MNETFPPDLPRGVAGALSTLRHALADPLSAAGLKLEVLERRLAAVPDNGSSLADRVRGVKADLAAAGRLIGLLPRLASIAGELPSDTSIGDLCRAAGAPLEEGAAASPRLLLRRQAAMDAVGIVVAFLRLGSGGLPPRARAEVLAGQVSLRVEALGAGGRWAGTNPERLFELPPGEEQAEELFLARAGIESDGGRLQLAEQEGLLIADLSWPLPAAAAGRTA